MVRGAEYRSMLNGECGEVGIGCQVATGAQRKQKVAQRLGVAGAGMD
jgi:predicted small metal-binding protein